MIIFYLLLRKGKYLNRGGGGHPLLSAGTPSPLNSTVGGLKAKFQFALSTKQLVHWYFYTIEKIVMRS